MLPGQQVRILPPFADAFPGVYTISDVDGSTCFLDGIPEGFTNAFDASYLEAV